MKGNQAQSAYILFAGMNIDGVLCQSQLGSCDDSGRWLAADALRCISAATLHHPSNLLIPSPSRDHELALDVSQEHHIPAVGWVKHPNGCFVNGGYLALSRRYGGRAGLHCPPNLGQSSIRLTPSTPCEMYSTWVAGGSGSHTFLGIES